MLDVLGLGRSCRRPLRRLVGVQRPLVVGVRAGVELAAGQLHVEHLQLLTQRGDVLEGELAHRLELGLLALQSLALVGLDHGHHGDGRDHEQDQEDRGTPWRQRTWGYEADHGPEPVVSSAGPAPRPWRGSNRVLALTTPVADEAVRRRW